MAIGGERRRSDGDLLRHPRRAVWWAAGGLAIVAALAVTVALEPTSPPALQPLDDAWQRAIAAPSGIAHALARLLEFLGSGWVMIPLRIVVAAWLALRRRRWDLAAWLIAWAFADALTVALKPSIARARPEVGASLTSFPSAHAKTAAQVAVGLVLVTTSPWGRREWAWVAAVAWIVAMSLSRNVLDAHWLSDVVAGSLLGAASAVGAATVAQILRDRAPPTPPSA